MIHCTHSMVEYCNHSSSRIHTSGNHGAFVTAQLKNFGVPLSPNVRVIFINNYQEQVASNVLARFDRH
jgi:hypothetical protein